MSTRCHIKIVDGDKVIRLYHHSDGYPEGVGADLKDMLKRRPDFFNDPEYRTRDLIQNKMGLNDVGYAPAFCIHGDENYVYVIDCGNRTLKCYKHNWDEGEDCIKPENEVEIE